MEESNPKILILGSNGQLGQELQMVAEICEEPIDFVFSNRESLDLANIPSIEPYIRSIQPSVIINASAYTAVDLAEKETEIAYAINAEAPKEIGRVCKELGIRLVHISTDFVFDGMKSSPYLETDPTNPLSVYGKSKLLGERNILDQNLDAIVIRTSWVYSSYGKNFFNTIVRLAQEKEELRVIDDQVGCPTWARDLAWFTYFAALREETGIFHFTNEGVASWYDFAQSIVDSMGLDCQIIPIPSKDYPTPAQRPSFSILNKVKTRSTFGFENNHWRDCVQALADELMMAEDEMDDQSL
jgi:dTDP-4-dehydrorhamnose reductase